MGAGLRFDRSFWAATSLPSSESAGLLLLVATMGLLRSLLCTQGFSAAASLVEKGAGQAAKQQRPALKHCILLFLLNAQERVRHTMMRRLKALKMPWIKARKQGNCYLYSLIGLQQSVAQDQCSFAAFF